jgi:hypothetical protein
MNGVFAMTRFMRRRTVLLSATAALCVLPAALSAQDTTAVKSPTLTVGPPIRAISTASAVSEETFGTVTDVQELPDGRILVNDGMHRRLLLMDTTLHTVHVILDSLSAVRNTYGVRAGALIPFTGDTTLFLDPASYAMLVIDPQGNVQRVRSVWRAQDVYYVTNATYGVPGVDSRGRIVYRVPAQVSPEIMAMAMSSDVPFFPPQPDSAFIVAADLSTRRLDTLGSIRIPQQELRIRRTEESFSVDQVINPLPRTDEWAVLPDGRVAFVRGQDYRIDYLNPDGTWTSSPKLPYPWQRLLDEDKQKFVDSVRALAEKSMATQFATSTIRWVNMYNGKYPENFKVPEGYTPPPGFPKDWFMPPGVKFPENYVYACAPGQKPPAGASSMMGTMMVMGDGARVTTMSGMPMSGAPSGGGAPACLPAPVVMSGGISPPPPKMRPVIMVDPETLPDYRPPFLTGAVRADEDGNLWIKFVQPEPIPGGPVYDIVSPAGELVDRIQLPPGYTLVGFGPGRIVYLQMRDAEGIHLARVRLK